MFVFDARNASEAQMGVLLDLTRMSRFHRACLVQNDNKPFVPASAVVVIVDRKQSELYESEHAKSATNWTKITQVEEGPDDLALSVVSRADAASYHNKSQRLLLAKMFRFAKDLWRQELGVEPNREKFRELVDTATALEKTSKTEIARLSSLTSNALHVATEAKQMLEETLPSCIRIVCAKVETLEEKVERLQGVEHDVQERNLAAIAEQRQILAQYEANFRQAQTERSTSSLKAKTAFKEATAAAGTLRTKVPRQYFRRQMSKMVKQTSIGTKSTKGAKGAKSAKRSLASQQFDLITSICRIVGIELKSKKKNSKKRSSRSKKKAAQTTNNAVTRAELPDYIAELVYNKLGSAETLADICTTAAMECPPTMAVSSHHFAKQVPTSGPAGSSKVKAMQVWQIIRNWALALCEAIDAENAYHSNRRIEDELEAELSRQQHRLRELGDKTTHEIGCAQKDRKQTEKRVAATKDLVAELESQLERADRLVEQLNINLLSKWPKEIAILKQQALGKFDCALSDALGLQNVPPFVVAATTGASLCLLGPLSQRSRVTCRSAWVKMLLGWLEESAHDIHEHRRRAHPGAEDETTDTILERAFLPGLMESVLKVKIPPHDQRGIEHQIQQSMASMIGWSAENMDCNSMTSLCIALYWGSSSTIVDPHNHFQWLVANYVHTRPAVLKEQKTFAARQFCNTTPPASDRSAWHTQKHIIVTNLHSNSAWLRYRVMRTVKEKSAKRRQSVTRGRSQDGRRKSNAAQSVGGGDGEKVLISDLGIVQQNHSNTLRGLMLDMSEQLGNTLENIVEKHAKINAVSQQHSEENKDTGNNYDQAEGDASTDRGPTNPPVPLASSCIFSTGCLAGYERILNGVQSLSHLELRVKHLCKEITQGLQNQGQDMGSTTHDDGAERVIRAFLLLQSPKLPCALDFAQLESIVRAALRTLGGKRAQRSNVSKAILVTLIQSIVRGVHKQDALPMLMLLSREILDPSRQHGEWDALLAANEWVCLFGDDGTAHPKHGTSDGGGGVIHELNTSTVKSCELLAERVHAMRNLPDALADPKLSAQWRLQMQLDNGMEGFCAPDFSGCIWARLKSQQTLSSDPVRGSNRTAAFTPAAASAPAILSPYTKNTHSMVRRLLVCIALHPERMPSYFQWFLTLIFGDECSSKDGFHLENLECEVKFLRNLLSAPTSRPFHVCCGRAGKADAITSILRAGELSGIHYQSLIKGRSRRLPESGMPCTICSIFQFADPESAARLWTAAEEAVQHGGWLVVADIHFAKCRSLVDDLLVRIGKLQRRAQHAKFRLWFVSKARSFGQPVCHVRNELRFAAESDHSVRQVCISHLQFGPVHAPLNDKRLRRAFFALVYIHGALCAVFGNRRHYRSLHKNMHKVLDIGQSDFVCMYQHYRNLVQRFGGTNGAGLDVLLHRVVSDAFAGMGALSADVLQFVRDALTVTKESCWPKAVPDRIIENASRNGFLFWLRQLGPSIDGVHVMDQFGHIDAGMPARRLCQELDFLVRVLSDA
jgi:hypothetical protein